MIFPFASLASWRDQIFLKWFCSPFEKLESKEDRQIEDAKMLTPLAYLSACEFFEKAALFKLLH